MTRLDAAGTPAAKAAPKKRRGGKHRNKGLAAAAENGPTVNRDADTAVQSSRDVSSDTVSDSLSNLQLERLNSNGAAGQPLLIRSISSVQFL